MCKPLTMQMCGGVDVKLHILNLSSKWGEKSAWHPGHFTSVNRTSVANCLGG